MTTEIRRVGVKQRLSLPVQNATPGVSSSGDSSAESGKEDDDEEAEETEVPRAKQCAPPLSGIE